MKLLKRFGILALTALLSASAADAYRITAELVPGGILTKYSTRVLWDAAFGALAWNVPANISVTNGASGSQNARALLLNDSAGTATIVTVCTPALPSGGFSSGPDGLLWTTSTTYSGACRQTATRPGSTTPALGDFFSVVSAAAVGADITAPPVVTGLVCTSGQTGTVPCTFDPSFDTSAGTDYYELRAASTVVATIASDEAIAKQPALTTYNIGSGTSTHTATRSGNQLTFVCAGTGIDGTADGACAALAQVNGEVCISGKVTSVSLASTFNKVSSEFRATVDANSIAYSGTILRTSSAYTYQVRRRSTTAGSRFTIIPGITISALPFWPKVCKAANGDLTYSYSYDGNAFTAIGTLTSTGLPSNAYAGWSATATTAGTAVTAVVEDTNMWTGTAIAVTYNNSTGAATSHTVHACDSSANCQVYGAAVSATPLAPADITSPTIPASPSASASGTTTINFSASAATDANGVRGYVWCIGPTSSPCTDAAEQASVGYSVTGLTASTTRYGKVKAVDTAGNLSGYSTQVNATTASSGVIDTTTVPTMSCGGISETTIRCTSSAITNAEHYITAWWNGSSWNRLTQYDVAPYRTALTVDFAGWTPGATGCYRRSAANVDESLVGPWSQTGTPSGADCGTTTSTSGAIKWHPGTYVASNGKIWDAGWQASFDADVSAICSNANVKGIQKTLTWAALEGPALGNYATGFANVDYMISKLQACGKRLMIKYLDRTFGGPHTGTPTASSEAWLIPSYIMTDSTYGGSVSPYGIVYSPVGVSWTGGLKTAARFWEAPVNDRLIALAQAYGARYNSNSYFEMWASEETAAAVPTSQGFSGSAHITQIKRQLAATSVAFPNTQVRLLANFVAGDMVDLIAYCYSLRNCAIGGPDPELPLPTISRTITGNRVFRGLDGGTDKRGATAWVAEQQDFGMIASSGGYDEPPSDISTYQQGTMHNNYMVWAHNADYVSEIVPYIASSSGAVYSLTCPTNYASCTP